MTENYLLEVKNVSKSFGVVKALNRIDFNVRPNEIHALCGENGAGKSTLMNILSGVYPYGSYGGEVYYDGELCKFRCNVTRSVSKMTEIERRGGKRWDKPKKAGKSRDCGGGKF